MSQVDIDVRIPWYRRSWHWLRGLFASEVRALTPVEWSQQHEIQQLRNTIATLEGEKTDLAMKLQIANNATVAAEKTVDIMTAKMTRILTLEQMDAAAFQMRRGGQ